MWIRKTSDYKWASTKKEHKWYISFIALTRDKKFINMIWVEFMRAGSKSFHKPEYLMSLTI